MVKKQKEDWQDRLVDLVEYESYLMTGNKSKKHFSGKCVMNDILDLVREEIKKENQELLKKTEKEIEKYFKGLIMIPNPQATKKELIKTLIKNLIK